MIMDSYQWTLNIGLPIITLLLGWVGNAYRTKEKKKSDEVDYMRQILDSQKEFITECKIKLEESAAVNARIDRILNMKMRSIRQANICKHTNEDDGCPVLKSEEQYEDMCLNCKIKKNDNGEN